MTTWLVWVLGAVAALILIDQLLLAAERQGWIYWRRSQPSRRTMGTALLTLQAILEPDRHATVEERQRLELDDAEEGDPPDHDR